MLFILFLIFIVIYYIIKNLYIIEDYNNNYMLNDYSNIIPLGDHCAIPLILKELDIRKKSYPFDWYVKAGSNISESNIELNINLLYDLLDGISATQVTNKLLGNSISQQTTVYNNVWFPHEHGSIEDVNTKYTKRFERVLSDINNKDNINLFIILTRKCYIKQEFIDNFYLKIMNLNKDNRIIFISGINHEYLYNHNYPNLEFKYIDYDISKYEKYDYTDFRPQIKSFLQSKM